MALKNLVLCAWKSFFYVCLFYPRNTHICNQKARRFKSNIRLMLKLTLSHVLVWTWQLFLSNRRLSVSSFVWRFLCFSRPSGTTADLTRVSRRAREVPSGRGAFMGSAFAATCVCHVWTSTRFVVSPLMKNSSFSTPSTAITRLLTWAQH